MRWLIALLIVTTGFVMAVAEAPAQPRTSPKLVRVTPIKTIKPLRGFIDDPFLFDGAGGRLLYINADAGYLAELIVIDLAQAGARLTKLDITKFTTTPVAVHFVGDGFFVVSRPKKDAQATAALIGPTGKVTRKFGPANDITLTTRDGNRVVAMYSVEERRKKKAKPMFHHKVELAALDGKKSYGKPRVLITDDKGYSPKLDFRINHWQSGYTTVVGIKGGTWDAKENQRSPDHEAWYDMFTGVFSKRVDIVDILEHAHRMRELAKHHNESQFLAVSRDLKNLELLSQERHQPVALAQPFAHYDPKSLQYQATDDGLFFFTLKIDPVNAEAVARKKADPEYLDLYEYRIGDKKATRRARILMTSKRSISWRTTGEYWVLVPRLMGFSRGGKELQIYKLNK